jgi:hypothetical protein
MPTPVSLKVIATWRPRAASDPIRSVPPFGIA